SSVGTVQANGSGGFDVLGSTRYVGAGSYPVTVQITDVDGSSATAGSTAQVADAPLSASGTTVWTSEGSAFSGVVAAFTDANSFASTGDFTTTISWGDGSQSAGSVQPNGSGFDVSGEHVYHQAGSYPLTVQIADVGGSGATAWGSASVAD